MSLRNKKLRYATLCSGIEAPSLTWKNLGWNCVFFCEVDKFANHVLEQHYPQIPNLGDINDINAPEYVNKLDLLIAGTPCQSFSIAGKGQSLEDSRGNLSLRFGDVCNEINPEFIIWENVPGILSTRDNAFGTILGKFCGNETPLQPAGKRWTNAGCVFGEKRNVAWRIFNSKYFGIPQQRKRIIVISCPRNGYNPLKILFEPINEGMDTAANKHFGKNTSPKNQRKSPTDINNSLKQPHIFKIRCGCSGGGKGYLGRDELAYTLSTRPDQYLFNENKVRKLTPTEYERIQGFPDNYTKILNYPDSFRYKAIGNSMPVPLIRWLGEKIQKLINESE